MSKIGEAPVTVLDGVDVTITADTVEVKGPKGQVNVVIPKGIIVKKNENIVNIGRLSETKKVRSLHGLIRSLVSNAVNGVVKPWEKYLEVHGTGYKVKMQGKDLVFDVGYSHSVTFSHLDGLEYAVDKNKVTVSGIDKQFVGEIANKIKSIRRPDPYKGKGIRYEGEVLHLKPGKKAATG
jgi:large subunit ribosomal protein L6